MFKNYFKIAVRNLQKNKSFSAINIIGLTIGLASVILILLFVEDELKYDRFFDKSERIYQVNLEGNFGGQEFRTGNTPPTAGPALQNEFPEIESFTRIYRPGDIVVSTETSGTEKYFTEKGIMGVDSNFLRIFTYSLLEGDRSACLQAPNAIVITKQIAEKYFGSVSAVGRTLLLNNKKEPFTVTAVLNDIPSQSSLRFDILAPVAAFPVVKQFSWSWIWCQVNTYVKLKDKTKNDFSEIRKLESKFPAMIEVQAAKAFKRIGKPLDEFRKSGGRYELHLQPLNSIHLHSEGIDSRLSTLSNIKYVYVFCCIALFIIILACVNFMNLSTAQFASRTKEVGIRKVLGSVKSQLIKQFLAEAMVYNLISCILAMLVVFVMLEPFNTLVEKRISYAVIFEGKKLLFLVILILVTGLLAGSYPAFYLSTFKPATVLKGIKNISSGLSNIIIRNGLVVFQFSVSIVLIISTIIVYMQLRYSQNMDLGLNKENILIISSSNRLGKSEETFKNEISKIPGIVEVSRSSGIPTKSNFTDSYIPEKENSGREISQDIALTSFLVDNTFLPLLQMKLLEGRNFETGFSDSASVILNESALKQIGWKDPLGKYMTYPGGNGQVFKVVGIIKDFNFESIHTPISPFALFHQSSKSYDLGISYMLTKVKSDDLSTTLNDLEKKWKSFSPSMPFDYSFLDNNFDALYNSEKRLGTVFGIFTCLSVFVGCLGLFGLVAYTTERRAKEIGIRKVLGARAITLIKLLSGDFLVLVLTASLIAFPIAWYVMNKWLEDFAYKISISWWIFAISGMAALCIAWITVSSRVIRTVFMNPVKSLRTE